MTAFAGDLDKDSQAFIPGLCAKEQSLRVRGSCGGSDGPGVGLLRQPVHAL